MIVRPKLRRTELILSQWPMLALTVGYSVVVTYFHIVDDPLGTIPVAIPAMLGTALSILLGFRTASSYDRWWEARKVWGAIVNDSRTLARQVLSLFVQPPADEGGELRALQKQIVYRQIAWCWSLSHALRGEEPLEGSGAWLEPDEIAALEHEANVPNALLQTQSLRVQEACQRGYLDRFFVPAIDTTLARLCDHMGMCERIKNTVFPRNFDAFTRRIILFFFFLTPPALADHLQWLTVPVVFLLAFVFLMIEATCEALETPFENTVFDTPMTAISRTIEINLRQQLGEKELPQPVEAVDGVLM